MATFSESRSASGSVISLPEPLVIPPLSPPKRRSLSPSQRLHQLALDVASISPKAIAAFAALGRFAKFINTPPPWLSILALVNNQILFALMHVLASPTLKLIPPMGLAMLRVGIALPFLFFVAVHEKSLHKIKLRDYPYMAFLGLVGVALPQTLIFVGNQLSGPNVIAIMAPAAPVYAAIFAVILKLEMFTWYKAGGTLLSVIGALIILRPDKMSFSDGASTGALIMVFQTACYATFLIALRIKMITHPYPFGIYAHASAWGLLYIMLVGLPTGWALFTPAMVPTSGWVAVVYCGFIISFFAHGVQSWAVKNTSASFPSLFSCLNPFFTGFLSFMILGETMRGASDAIGLMFNVAGLLMVIYSRQRFERGSTPKAMSTPLSQADRMEDQVRVAVVLAELEQGRDEYEKHYEEPTHTRPVMQAWGKETEADKSGTDLLKGVGGA